uniref:Peptidase M12B domain-containing protein n=4 Tax=Clytia hemisphaerica TaxID=252671 RepID=A0A7M5X1E9_9CNID
MFLNSQFDSFFLFAENFAKTLHSYEILHPTIYFDRTMETKITWEQLHISLPDTLYIGIKISGQTLLIQLDRKNDLLTDDFSSEDVIDIQAKEGNGLERRLVDSFHLHCYYAGFVFGISDSKVTISTCDGLRGYINLDNEAYQIQPMRAQDGGFAHLVYRSDAKKAEHGRSMECVTGRFERKFEDGQPDTTFDENMNIRHFTKESNHHQQVQQINRTTQQKRTRRSTFSQQVIATVEVFVVADKDMIQFHGNDTIEDYVLTMMNMVSDMYKEPSLGAIVNIVVTKLLVLDTDEVKISSNGDKTLASFCEWQFLQNLRNPNSNQKFDVALLLTRKDLCLRSDVPCGTIGLAYIGGMCSSNRKCAVIEDIGLNTAYTIAHELGHTLGMQHDGLDNNCATQSNGRSHMMASHWPAVSAKPMKWSKCSANKLQSYLSSYKSFCIQSKAPVFNIEYEHRRKFPGELYDADTQCQQQFGKFSRHCKYFKRTGMATKMCQKLWCEVEGEQFCMSKLDAAAKGTECNPAKWCMYGKCVPNTEIPHAIHGGWSKWTGWSRCTRHCGIGVQQRERFCDNPSPRNGGQPCPGERIEHKTCNTRPCMASSRDFRRKQCSQINNSTHTFVPVHSSKEPCSLHCRPESNNAYYSIRVRSQVVDGTPCYEGSSDICVNGQCRQIGCDLKLNSKLFTDVCGVCGGKADTCRMIEGKFSQPLGEGYVKAVDIPRGARNVLVQEVRPCPSFLALSGPGSYNINGNYTIKLPGTYDFNGTSVTYRRRGTQETYLVEGPLKTTMHFKVLFQGYNFGIKYRYVMPIDKEEIEKNSQKKKDLQLKKKQAKRFGWMQGQWKKCSVQCGGGIMRREKARCLHFEGTKATFVENGKCVHAKSPVDEVKACNEQKCQKAWYKGDWSYCSRPCGNGRKTRKVVCKEQKQNGGWKIIDPNECNPATKPISVSACIIRSCFLKWEASKWGKCQGKCGKTGFMEREVTCSRPNGCNPKTKPIVRRRCRMTKCKYGWTVQPWGPCSKSCGKGAQTRLIDCRSKKTFKIAPTKLCTDSKQPRVSRACLTKCKKTPSRKIRYRGRRPSLNQRPLQSPASPSKNKVNIFKNLLNISVPINRTKQCKDRLLSWSCKMFILVYSAAGGRSYCYTAKAQSQCCATCRIERNKRRRRRKRFIA